MKNEILNTCYTKEVEAYLGGRGYEGSNSHTKYEFVRCLGHR